MAIFPPVRVLMAPKSRMWSIEATGSFNAPMPEYPGGCAVDGWFEPAARSTSTTDVYSIDLGAPQQANIIGVFGHNIQPGLLVGLQGGNSGFGTLALNRAAGARSPAFWVDTRDAAGVAPTAQFWRVIVNGNNKPVSITEVIVANGYEFEGLIEGQPSEEISFYQARAQMEYGQFAISASGAYRRTMTLRLQMTGDQAAILETICDEVGAEGWGVTVVPDTHRNDLWFVIKFPNKRDLVYTRGETAEIETSITLVDVLGVVT